MDTAARQTVSSLHCGACGKLNYGHRETWKQSVCRLIASTADSGHPYLGCGLSVCFWRLPVLLPLIAVKVGTGRNDDECFHQPNEGE